MAEESKRQAAEEEAVAGLTAPFTVPANLAQQSEGELQHHALTWARLAAERTLTLDERIDLGIRVRVALQHSAASAAAADSRFILWSEAFGVSVQDVDMAIDRWTRRANSC